MPELLLVVLCGTCKRSCDQSHLGHVIHSVVM